MNIKHNYNDTRGSHDVHIWGYTTSIYQNSALNIGIKLYNKSPEKKIKRLHLIKKKELKSKLMQNAFYTVEEYLHAAL
jgi:nicotinic acid phosphoribosyltransferase